MARLPKEDRRYRKRVCGRKKQFSDWYEARAVADRMEVRDGQLTIHEIISLRPGAGAAMLARLCGVAGARFIAAKCPSDLPANGWYRRMGFVQTSEETTRSGRTVNRWLYWL